MNLFYPSHKVIKTRRSLAEGPTLHFWFMGGPIIIKDLGIPKALVDLQPLFCNMRLFRNNSV